jgi:lipopolysaccharide/colanic/teichoic acid biosynthesis glycosyltransferase
MKNRSPQYTKGLDKNLYLKFAVDRCFSWVLLMLASPLIMFIAYCIWVEGLFFKNARGPIFYRERRISQGNFFTLYKFRVLTASALLKAATEDSVWFLQFESENTTLMGKILIQCYLDEMPQLLNIFLGRMSFVGPRPRVPPIYEEDVGEGHRALKYLKGGITGPAQLAKGLVENGGLELSEEYLKRCNSYGPLRLLKYDLGIMWKSVFKLMKAEGL